MSAFSGIDRWDDDLAERLGRALNVGGEGAAAQAPAPSLGFSLQQRFGDPFGRLAGPGQPGAGGDPFDRLGGAAGEALGGWADVFSRLLPGQQRYGQAAAEQARQKAATAASGGDDSVPTAPWRSLIDRVVGEMGGDAEAREAAEAIMLYESQGTPTARSSQGAMGLMQVMPMWFQPGEDGMDPETNVRKGVSILLDGYRRYGSWDKAAAAYLGAIDSDGNITSAADANGTTGPAYVQRFNQLRESVRRSRQGPAGGVVPNAATGGGVFPVKGYTGQVSTHWDSGERGGTDIMAPEGTPVAAPLGGTVTYAGYDDTGGWAVMIQTDNGLQVYLAHLYQAPGVQVGQRVKAGTTVGGVGRTGNAANGPTHLHIGIGRTIRTGAGAQGGTGSDFDAVSWLNSAPRW